MKLPYTKQFVVVASILSGTALVAGCQSYHMRHELRAIQKNSQNTAQAWRRAAGQKPLYETAPYTP